MTKLMDYEEEALRRMHPGADVPEKTRKLVEDAAHYRRQLNPGQPLDIDSIAICAALGSPVKPAKREKVGP